jgi:MarR family transcriptional regulator, transcriptional regulator for hemolysin
MPDLSRDLLVLLNDVARLVRTVADRKARAHGMTRAQWMILFRLRRQDGLTQRELAEVLEVEPITVGRLVDRLETRGLVERRADPRDRGVWRVHLTAAAPSVLAELDAIRVELDAEATRDVPPELREATVEALLAMKRNLLAAGSLPGEAA